MEKVLDYNRSFKTMRLLSFSALGGFIFATCFYLYKYNDIMSRQSEKIFVVTDKGTYAAYAKQESEVSNFEAKYVSELFINTMFAHDADTYSKHMEAALNLCDEETGTYLASSFEKGKVQDNYKRWGSRTEVEIDSIRIISNGVPMRVVAYFRQNHLVGTEQKAYLSMACKFSLIKLKRRHEKNPFGLKVGNFDFFQDNRVAPAQ
jgi:hypothetical protein